MLLSHVSTTRVTRVYRPLAVLWPCFCNCSSFPGFWGFVGGPSSEAVKSVSGSIHAEVFRPRFTAPCNIATADTVVFKLHWCPGGQF